MRQGTERTSFQGRLVMLGLHEGHFETVLEPLLDKGDLLLNLSVDVSSIALIRFCRKRGAFYLDTCNEPWPGRYDNPELSPSQRTNALVSEELDRDDPWQFLNFRVR